MRRPTVSSRKETVRRPTGVRSSSPSYTGTSSVLAAASAWVHPRLADAATQLLALQPNDPFRVLSAHFSTEALLLASYPETSASTDEKELEEEASPSLRSSSCSTRPVGKSSNALASKNKMSSGCGDPRSANDVGTPEVLEYLVEHNWVRRRLQPYGLHAVARSVCPSLDSNLDHPSAEPNASTGRTAAATAAQQQWMECFALLHRQSRLSSSEKAAASRSASQINGSVLPPVDYRATEEVPASLVFLYLMCVVEGHVRRVDCGAEATEGPHSTFAFRRIQLSVKLLALQLFAALMKRQELDESDRCSSTSEGDDEEAPMSAVGNADPNAGLPAVASPPDSLLRRLYALPPTEVEEFHHWLLQRLREAPLYPTSALQGTSVPQPSSSQAASAKSNCSTEAGRPVVSAAREQAALLQLQSHTSYFLHVILSSDSSAVPEASAFTSVDTFVSVMQCLASVLVAHQSTAMSMAITLSTRVGRSLCISAGRGTEKLRWVKTLLHNCTARLANAVPTQADAVPAHPSPLPPVWEVYVKQIATALHCLQQDGQSGDEDEDAFAETGVKLALSALSDERGSDDGAYVTTDEHVLRCVPNSMAMTALVSEWVTRVFEVCIRVLSSPPCTHRR